MAKIVLIPTDISEPGKEYLREKGYVVKMGKGATEEQIIEDAQGVDAVLARNEKITKRVLDGLTSVKIVSKHGVGLDNIEVGHAESLGIWVTNGPESNAVAVAERTLGFIIDLAKNTILMDKLIRQGDYDARNRIKGMDLEGKVLGLIGLGKIGSLVGKKACYGLGMKILGYDPFIAKDAVEAEIELVSSVEEIWEKSDFISLHLPANAETRRSIGSKQFSLMKPTAYLINCARGEVVREDELVEALRTKQIAGAALDVYEVEPPAKDNPLFSLDNVTLSPHDSALTRETTDRMGLHAAIGIHEILTRQTPTWPVNKPKNPRQKLEI